MRYSKYSKLVELLRFAYVSHVEGHKNSNGELAEWVIKSENGGHIISSHKTEDDAKKHLQDIEIHKKD